MKKTGRPLVLTINGKAEAVVIDATAYRAAEETRRCPLSCRRRFGLGPGAGRSGATGPRSEL